MTQSRSWPLMSCDQIEGLFAERAHAIEDFRQRRSTHNDSEHSPASDFSEKIIQCIRVRQPRSPAFPSTSRDDTERSGNTEQQTCNISADRFQASVLDRGCTFDASTVDHPQPCGRSRSRPRHSHNQFGDSLRSTIDAPEDEYTFIENIALCV